MCSRTRLMTCFLCIVGMTGIALRSELANFVNSEPLGRWPATSDLLLPRQARFQAALHSVNLRPSDGIVLNLLQREILLPLPFGLFRHRRWKSDSNRQQSIVRVWLHLLGAIKLAGLALRSELANSVNSSSAERAAATSGLLFPRQASTPNWNTAC